MKKNRSSSKKPRRSKRSQKRLQRKLQKTQSSNQFGYEPLEPRYALDASFTFDNGELDLFAFADNVDISQTGNSFTATLASGAWTFLEDGDPVDPADIPGNIMFGGGTLDVTGVGSVDIENALDVGQNAPIVASNGDISIEGTGSVTLNNVDNALGTLDIDVDGDVDVFSMTTIDSANLTAANIAVETPSDANLGVVGEGSTTSIDIDAAEISATEVVTMFDSVSTDINSLGKTAASSVRLRATGGAVLTGIIDPATGMPISDTPIERDNNSGGITISQSIVSDQILLQSSDGLDIPIGGLDTLYLFLGGDLESESRGVYQLDVPSLQQLSVRLYDGFAITSDQDLTIGNFTYTGLDPGATTLQFTDAYSDLYSNVSAASLTFDAPFYTQKLVANITTDIEQNPGAVLTADDLYISAETVVLDNPNNDFQRIASYSIGFLDDNQINDEDGLTIRDQGTLEIAVLDNLPDDDLIVDLALTTVEEPVNLALEPITFEGITVAGQVDILTGFGGPIPVQPDGAREPTFAQLGRDGQIEKFEIPRDRSGTQTGVFRDENYDGSLRPVYYIEFVHDGTQDLVIRTDKFERGNPELVRDFIDIEIALYNNLGELVTIGEEFEGVLDEIDFAAGTLPAGRYFVAASAFSSNFEDDFIVNTSNTQTGTLNVTITGNLPVTPELSRDLTQAPGASLIVLGGDDPIPPEDQAEVDPDDFPPEILVQLDPDAEDFVPDPVEIDPMGNLVPVLDGRATLGAANGGTVLLGINSTNDIRELVISDAGAVEFADTNDLLVSNLDTPGQSRLAAGRGGEGELTLGDVDSSTLLLQAASGVTQEGAITTDQLLLGGNQEIDGGGDFVILSDTLENVAFNLPAGNLALTTSQELNIAFVQFNDIENPTVPSFIFDESVVSGTARIEAASININTQVQAETLVLNVQDSIVQAAPSEVAPNTNPVLIPSAPSIVATSLSVSAADVDLNQLQNSITRLAGEVTGSLGLVNQNPIVFATINNTVETITRLRPIGVSQTFTPLETINGLTVDGTADITSGLTIEQIGDVPPNLGLSVVTVNPVVVSNDDGTNTAEFFGDATQEAQIKDLIDVIYAQVGVDIEFLPTVFWNNTFANIGDGADERPIEDFNDIIANGDAAGVGSPDPNVIDLYAIQTMPGPPGVIGLGFLGLPGNAIQVDEDLSTDFGRSITAVLAGHEIGHNLGLEHVTNEVGNLMTPFVFATPPATLNAEQGAIIEASPLSSEPVTVGLLPIVGGFTQEADAPLNIGSANLTAQNDGDIILLHPDNDINFNSTDARDVNVALIDGSIVTGITADRDLSIQSVGELTIVNANTVDGNVTINTGGNVLIGEISANGSTTVISGGSINDLQGELSATGTITLDAVDEIDGIDFADQSVVVASSDTGDISLLGLGELTLQNVSTATGAINVTTAGDVLVGSVTSASTIDVDSSGSINDLQDDLVADFSAAGLVSLAAAGDVGGGASPTIIDTAGQLEFAPGTLTVNSTDGTISVGGDGPLVFEDIKTPNDLVISSPDSLTIGNVMARSATLSAVTDVTITSVMTVNETIITAGRDLDVGDVMASLVTLTAERNLVAGDVVAETGEATLQTTTGDIVVDSVTADNAAVTIDAGATLTSGSATGTEATLTAGGDLDAGNVTSTVGDINITSNGNLTAAMVMAQNDANLMALGDITTTLDIITKDGVATLVSGGSVDVSGLDVNGFTIDAFNDIAIGDLTVTDSVNLVSRGAIETGDISATSIELDAGTSLDTGDLTATTGNVDLTSTTGLTTGDVTADSGDITIDSADLLQSGALAANNVTVTSGDNAMIGAVSAATDATLDSQGELIVTTVDAQTASLTAALNIRLDIVNTVEDAVITAGAGNLNGDRVVSTTGTVSLTSLQRVNVLEAIASGDVTLEAGGQVNTNLVESETGSVTINANGNLSATVVDAAIDAILIAPRSDVYSDMVTAGESAQLTSGAYLFTRNVAAPDVSMIAGTNQVARSVVADTAEITAVGDLGLNDIRVEQLTIEAGDDIFDAGFLDGKPVKTSDLVIRVGNSNDEGTFGGVVLETDVDTLTVITEGNSFGNIIIRELDDIVLGDIEVANGGINISAGGTISGGNLRTVTQSDSNDVRLIAMGDASDIRVDSIDVGNIGDAFLIADDDVVITGDGNQVNADYMFVWARNRTTDGTNGIALSTNAVAVDLVVGDIADATQNRGDISITDADALNVNFARTLNGTISATANGNLVTNNIQSAGVNVDDAISLTAIGTGSDVVTNRVAVVQQAGGVVLTADDDVRDANPRDNRLIIADNLTMVARNNLNDTFNGINSQSRVKSINAVVDSSLVIPDGNLEGLREASILLNNIGKLTVNEASVSSGLVRVINNNGFLTVNDISLSSTSSDNRVFVQTTGNGSDITVGRINAGSRGTVTIDSADDIFDTDQLDELFVEGRFLSATSRNGTDDPFDGIVLNVDVDSFVADAQLDGVDVIRQRG